LGRPETDANNLDDAGFEANHSADKEVFFFICGTDRLSVDEAAKIPQIGRISAY